MSEELDELLPSPPLPKIRRAVFAVQIGDAGYRIDRTTNFPELRCASVIQRAAIDALISQGVTVNISRNK